MNSDKQAKWALVTGGSGAIGAAICLRLARAGFSLLVHSSSHPEKAGQQVEKILALGGQAETICFDVSDAEQCRQQLEAFSARHTVQVIVSNAGIHADAPLAGMSASQWQEVIAVNLDGFFNVVQPLIMPMARTRWGRVIAISSVAARGNRGQSNYAAAKAGLEAAVRSLSLEMASRGITANSVAPGVIDSPMVAAHFDQAFIRQFIPARRLGQVEEVAGLVNFLASDEAAYITGQTIAVDGGMR